MKTNAIKVRAKADRLDDPSVRNADEVAQAFGADIRNGLTSAEASLRLEQDGPNELHAALRQPTWHRVLSHFQDTLIYLLLAAVVIALFAWVIEGSAGWPVDAIVIATIVLLNGVLGFVQEAKAQNAVAAQSRMTAATASALRDGQVLRGTQFRSGAWGRTYWSCARRRRSGRTFASGHVTARPGSFADWRERSRAQRRRHAAKGGVARRPVQYGLLIAQGAGRAVVTASGMANEIGSVAVMLEATVEEPTPLEKEVGRIGRMPGIAIVSPHSSCGST
jgi:magnesium-transporting ATPase (P-type)